MILGQGFKACKGVLRLDDRAFLLELKAVNIAPAFDLRPPFLKCRAVGFAAARFPHFENIFKHMADITNNRDVYTYNLVDR